jgi:hypothetical protein
MGYTCLPGDPPSGEEEVQIYDDAGEVTAVKTTGDSCIPAKQITWRGTVPGNSFVIHAQGARPHGNPTKVDGHATITSNGYIVAEWGGNTITYRRVNFDSAVPSGPMSR